jgi:homoserine kinase type II
MAVFTEVSDDEASALLRALNLGELRELRGIQSGIENTNYFVTAQDVLGTREFVLTLFERLTFEQLPFYLHLMKHLAQHGIPVPDPAADRNGDILHTVRGKPAAVVNKLQGRHELAPGAEHCAQVGAMLARMHLAGRDYQRRQPNLRGLAWWNETVPVVLPSWRSRTTSPPAPLTRRCPAVRCMPTCSATTSCSRTAGSAASSISILPGSTAGCSTWPCA